MKKILYLALVAIMGMGMISCGKEKNPPEINKDKKAITCKPSSLTFPYEGGKKNIELTASGKWKIVHRPSALSSIKPEVGDSGKTTIEIVCPAGDLMKDSIVFEMDGKRCILPVKRSCTTGFAVSATKKVDFAPGNLQYHAKKNQWRFAPNQYDVIGQDNENIAPKYDGWIDLFGWGTGNRPTLYTNDYDLYADSYSDFFGNDILLPDGNRAWGYTLLYKEEWYYLLHERKDAAKKMMTAEVDGIFGLMLLPEDWRLPKGSQVYPLDDQMQWFEDMDSNPINFGFGITINILWVQKNKFTVEQWKKLEDAGAVFLPASGSRLEKKYTGETGGTRHFPFGEYQCRERYKGTQYCLHITESRVLFSAAGELAKGRAVRGVKSL